MTAINSNRAIRGPVTAIPVVAGKGVRLREDIENNRIVAEADETVLYTNPTPTSQITTTTDFDLSEAVRNFERVRVDYLHSYGPDSPNCKITASVEALTSSSDTFALEVATSNSGNNNIFTDTNVFAFDSTKPSKITVVAYGYRTNVQVGGSTATGSLTAQRGIILLKVTGINRISASA